MGKSHRAILLEQRGTGRSMPTPFDTSTINLQTAHADLNRLLDHLKLSQAIFVGHSWGAMLAMSFASANPARVKSLVLIAPGPFKLDNVVFNVYATNKEARSTPAERKMLDSALKKMQSPNATKKDSAVYYKWELSPVIYDRNRIDSLVVVINKAGLNPKTGSFIFQSLDRQQFDLSKNLVAFTKPVHIITGAQDPMAFISYEIKILLPKSQLHWINRSGHFPMFEQPEQFYSILLNTIR
jgi:proline iminopeptidase